MARAKRQICRSAHKRVKFVPRDLLERYLQLLIVRVALLTLWWGVFVGVALLPFVDEGRLKKALAEVYPDLTEDEGKQMSLPDPLLP